MAFKAKCRFVKNSAGSVLVMSVIISLAIVLVGTAYLKFVDHHRLRLSYDIYDYLADGASYTGMATGLAENSSGGSFYESDIQELFASHGITVKYNYILKPEGDEEYGFSNTVLYHIIGQGIVSGPEFEDEFTSYIGHSASSYSYADWLYITDRETQEYRPSEPNGDDTLRFWTPDTLDGKVHSNDKLHFSGEPVFYEMVSSCSTRFSPVNAPQNVHFYGGYKLGVSRFDFPIQADSVRKYGWLYDGEELGWGDGYVTELTLEPNGFYVRHRPSNGGDDFRRDNNDFYDFYEGDITNSNAVPLKPYPASKALFIEGELWITAAKGKMHYNNDGGTDSLRLSGFSGELTIAASGDIIIPQDISYAETNLDGSIPNDCLSVLGIISEKHILMWRHCPTNLRVQAALAAIGYLSVPDSLDENRCANYSYPPDGIHGTISVDGINCYYEENEKQQLEIRGCLIQRERGLIHTHYGGPGLNRGFISKKYRYDFRFRHHPPPHFFKTRARADHFSLNLQNIFGLY